MNNLLENLKLVYEQKIQKESFLKKHAGKIAAGAGAITGGIIGRKKDIHNLKDIDDYNIMHKRNIENAEEYIKRWWPGSSVSLDDIHATDKNLEDYKHKFPEKIIGITDKYGKTAAGAAIGGIAAYSAYKGGKALYNKFKKK